MLQASPRSRTSAVLAVLRSLDASSSVTRLTAHQHSAIQELCVVLQVIELAAVVVELFCRSPLSLRFSG
eukprot:9733827-Heterocapsa_arctica.AAC.1